MLCDCIRDLVKETFDQIHQPRSSLVLYHRNHKGHNHSLHAQPNSLELEGQNRVSLMPLVSHSHAREKLIDTSFFWAGFNAICLVWTYFRLPEPTGLSYAELDTVCLSSS